MTCYACIHLMDGADSVKRCRVQRDALPVSPALEAGCKRFVREPGADDQIPIWYSEDWHVGGEGRGD